MSTRRITATLLAGLLDAAMKATGKGITETLVEALTQLQRRRFYEKAKALRGKFKLDLDMDEIRGRQHQ
jgi:hypothetical protein